MQRKRGQLHLFESTEEQQWRGNSTHSGEKGRTELKATTNSEQRRKVTNTEEIRSYIDQSKRGEKKDKEEKIKKKTQLHTGNIKASKRKTIQEKRES